MFRKRWPVFVTPLVSTVRGQASREGELTRAVVGRGTVVRHMRDGSVQMLFVTGEATLDG